MHIEEVAANGVKAVLILSLALVYCVLLSVQFFQICKFYIHTVLEGAGFM